MTKLTNEQLRYAGIPEESQRYLEEIAERNSFYLAPFAGLGIGVLIGGIAAIQSNSLENSVAIILPVVFTSTFLGILYGEHRRQKSIELLDHIQIISRANKTYIETGHIPESLENYTIDSISRREI